MLLKTYYRNTMDYRNQNAYRPFEGGTVCCAGKSNVYSNTTHNDLRYKNEDAVARGVN